MPAFVQKIMQHASCLGNTFDVETLSGIYSNHSEITEGVEIEEETILAALQQGIQAGLIFQIRHDKIDDSGSYFQYKFIHDRVQEAFYESMEKKDRIQYHIASAEYFSSSFSNFADAPQDTLFTIAHHYNLAIQKFAKAVEDNTADPKQIDHVVKVYFEAAKKAKQATAVEAASQFLSNASLLLPKDLIPAKEDHDYTEEESHDPDYVFAFNFLILRAECDGNCGEVESSSKIIDYLLKRGRSVRDRVRACNLNCVVLEAAGNFHASVKAACMALEILSIPLQLQNNPIEKMVAEISEMVDKAGGIHALLDRPPCSSLDALRIEVLSNMASPTYIIATDIGMNLYYAVAALGTKISFERGIAPVSASVIACYAAVLTALRIHALDYAQMSMACLKRYPHAISTPRNNHYNACFTLWQGEKMKKVRKVFMEGFKGLVENGDTYSLYTTVCMIPVSFADSVDEVEGYLMRSLSTLKNIKSLHRTYVDCIAAIVHCFHILRSSSMGDEKDRISSPSTSSSNSSNSPNSFYNGKGSPKKLRPQHPMQQQNGELIWRGFTDGFDELAYLYFPLLSLSPLSMFNLTFYGFAKANNDNNGAFFTCFLLHVRMKTAMLLGNYELAEELASKFNPIACADLLVLFDWQMLCMILLAARTPVLKKGEAPSEEYTNNIKKIKETRAEVQFFEKSPCLDSIINLVDAEVHRLEGRNDEARRSYEISIKRAKVAEIPSAQGFASELAMKFCLSIGDNLAASSYLSEAKGAYAIYGAFTKLQLLDANYIDLAKNINESVFANMSMNSTSVAASPTAIDFASTMKACQVISSEVNVDKLLCSMICFEIIKIKITQQNTGAQKVYFIVPDQSGKLFIEAYGDANNNIGTEHCDLSQNKSNEASKFSLAVSIVNYVQYTKQIVILDDAANSGNFTFDTHVQANKVKSIFCVPVLHQNAVAGVLYFENNLLPGAFTQDRVQTIQLISGQLAVSYQNAILFKNLQLANEKLEQKNKALVEFDQMKDQFLANTSHELRTPLNGIIGLAEYLIEMENNHSKKDSLTMIAASGKRLAHLVNDILDTSALKAGAFTIRLKPTDLNLIVKNVTDLSYHLLGSKDIVISNLVQDLPIMKLDESRMQQVLQNIVSNAIKFTNSGYVTVSSSVTNDWVSISVKDSGCGIAKEDQNMIFEEFKQVNGGINREAGGTGLGLSIAKKMVEMHEGRITVESAVGQGSTFTISLPTSRITEEEAGTLVHSRSLKTPKTNSSPDGSKTITILSVDDEPINQAIMEKLLGANFNVLHANNGKEALEMIMSREHPPDFVLLDVMMPEMSGLEVCEKIREKFPMCDLPVIMVSAKGKPENIAEGLSKGANDYIIKPVDKSELLARIRLQISICLSCKMLCEKNHDHSKNSGEIHGEDKKTKEGILEMLVCEACKQVPSYPGQKSLLLGRRGSKIQLVQNIAEETRNILELTNQLPLMVTLYDLDGVAVVRNIDAATQFNKSPHTPRAKNNNFIASLADRKEAESILSKVLAGDTVHHLYEIPHGQTKTIIAICARMLQLTTQNRRQKTAYIFVGEQYIEQSTTRRRSTSRAISTSTSPLLSSISSSTSTQAEPSIPQKSSPPTNPDPILISAYPPRLSELLHFQSVDFTHLSPEQRANLPKWINQVKTELALSQMAQNHSLISILFRPLFTSQPSASVGFYHSCKLSSPSIALLRAEIEKRLNVDSSHIYAIVKDENVLVEFDDDLSNGTRLDVYII